LFRSGMDYTDALRELNDRAQSHLFVAVAYGATGRPLMSAQGDFRHWTAAPEPGALMPPPEDMAGLYRVGQARIDLIEDDVERVERVQVRAPDDGLLFHMEGGGSIRVSWHG
jgi:catechol 2,3-dioxygenase-like lactoylglutathione lyase family enzyme